MRGPNSKWNWRGLLLCCWLLPSVVVAAVPIFEISRDGSPTHYLVGTIHVDVKGLDAVRQAARPLLAKVRTLALELVPDAAAIAQVIAGATRAQPHDPALELDPAQLELLHREMLARGAPAQVLPLFKPWVLGVMLSLPEDPGLGLDLWLNARAEEAGIRVIGLETPEEQLGALDALPESEQWVYLRYVLDNLAMLPRQMRSLLGAYLRGDIKGLASWADNEGARMPESLRDWYGRTLIAQRNRRMWERLQAHLRKGPIMVAVGALHLVGETGLVARFEGAGYRVRQL